MNEPMPNQPRDTYRPAKAQRRWADRATETDKDTDRQGQKWADRQTGMQTYTQTEESKGFD